MAYGLKVKDASGNACVITPDMGTVIGMGRVTMPSALVDTDKYYTTIALPDTIAVADLTVLAIPVKWHMTCGDVYQASLWASPNYAIAGAFLDDAYSYYTKDESTGVMSSYTAGDLSSGDAREWDDVLSAYPLVYWELFGASSVSDIKIFAATCYIHTVGPSANGGAMTWDVSNDFVYSIYTQGVETIDYMILNKKYNY